VTVAPGDDQEEISKEVLQLPDIPPVPKDIMDAVNQERLAVFVGAGPSCIMGYPTWPRLAEMVVEACRKHVGINPLNKPVSPTLWTCCSSLSKNENPKNNPKKAISICHQLFKEQSREDEFLELVASCLNHPSATRSSDDIYPEIYGLHGFYLTTNLDPEFDRLFPYKARYKHLDFDCDRIHRNDLYHLHGSIEEPKTMVITTEQYINRYRDLTFLHFLERVFTENVVLFLGYGLHEFEVLDYLITKADRLSSPLYQRYVLIDYNREVEQEPEADRLYYQSMGVTLVPYASSEDHDHSLTRVIRAWKDEIESSSAVYPQAALALSQAASSYSEDTACQILQMITEPTLRNEFFLQLKNSVNPIAWFERLTREGFLDPPSWLIYSYIEKVAAHNEICSSAETTELLLSRLDGDIDRQKETAQRIEGRGIDGWIVVTLFHLPREEDLLERFHFLRFALKKGDDQPFITWNLEKKIIPKILERRWKKALCCLIELILDDQNGVADGYCERRPYIQAFWADQITRDFVDPIISLCGREIGDLLLNKLHDLVGRNSSFYYSGRIRSLIDTSNVRAPHPHANILVQFYTEVLIQLPLTDTVEIVKELIQEENAIFGRIALVLIDTRFNDLRHLLKNWPSNPINDQPLELELYHLLKTHATVFTREEVDALVRWIESCNFGWDENEEEEDKRIALSSHRKYWYQTLEMSDHPDVIRGLAICSEDCPESPRVIHEEAVYTSAFEPTEAELKALRGMDMTEIARNMLDKFAVTKVRSPFHAGVEDLLHRSVSEDPSRYAQNLTPFVNLPPQFHYGILGGFEEAWREMRDFPWDPILEFIEEILASKPYGVVLPESSGDITSVVITIESLLLAGVRTDDHAIDLNLLGRTYVILKKLTIKIPPDHIVRENDRVSNAFNSIQGKALRAMIALVLHAKRRGYCDDIRIGVQAFLGDLGPLITNQEIVSMDYLTIIGSYYTILFDLNRDWTIAQHATIFSHEDSLWEATMTGLISFPDRITADVYTHLKNSGELIRAVRFTFSDLHVRSRLPGIICKGYFNGLDEMEDEDSPMLNTILTGSSDTILQIRLFFNKRRDEGIDDSKRKRIKSIWQRLMKRYNDGDEEIRTEIAALSSWLLLFTEIDEDIYGWMLVIGDIYKAGESPGSEFFEALRYHVDRDPQQVGDILLRSLQRIDQWAIIYKDHIYPIVARLYELGITDTANKICIKFLRNHEHFLDSLYYANNPSKIGQNPFST